jgi:hypothetical protein
MWRTLLQAALDYKRSGAKTIRVGTSEVFPPSCTPIRRVTARPSIWPGKTVSAHRHGWAAFTSSSRSVRQRLWLQLKILPNPTDKTVQYVA